MGPLAFCVERSHLDLSTLTCTVESHSTVLVTLLLIYVAFSCTYIVFQNNLACHKNGSKNSVLLTIMLDVLCCEFVNIW